MSETSWADALCKVIAERDALSKQLATAREDALKDAIECLHNANSNFAALKGEAPWSWNYEVEDMLLELIEEKPE